MDAQSRSSYGRAEVKTQSIPKPKKAKKKKKKEDSDFVFMDRQSIIETQQGVYPGVQSHLPSAANGRDRDRGYGGTGDLEGITIMKLSSSPKKHHPVSHPLHQVVCVCV